MSNWISTTLIIPADILDASNRLAEIMDPDTGGAATWGDIAFSADGAEPVTHYGTQTMMAPEYIYVLQSGDPDLVYAALLDLATEYGRDMPTTEDCEVFTASVIVRPGEDLMSVAAELGLVRV